MRAPCQAILDKVPFSMRLFGMQTEGQDVAHRSRVAALRAIDRSQILALVESRVEAYDVSDIAALHGRRAEGVGIRTPCMHMCSHCGAVFRRFPKRRPRRTVWLGPRRVSFMLGTHPRGSHRKCNHAGSVRPPRWTGKHIAPCAQSHGGGTSSVGSMYIPNRLRRHRGSYWLRRRPRDCSAHNRGA